MKISIISAVKNSSHLLPELIDSILSQTDKNFEWIIMDGESSDNTYSLITAISGVSITFRSNKDFGIYDAINRGLSLCSGDYYIVVGADDRLDRNAIKNYRQAIANFKTDIIVAKIKFGGALVERRNSRPWLHGPRSFISNHSLGTALKTSLHSKYGVYSSSFPIAADSLFILKCCLDNVSIYHGAFCAGRIGENGVSARDWAGSATELFRVQLIVGYPFFPQFCLLILRLIKGRSHVIKKTFNYFR